MRIVLAAVLCAFLFAGAGVRADEHYSEWGGGDKRYDALVERLNELIDDAEKARAAAPRLLQDFRDAIADYTAVAREPEPAPGLPPQKLVHDDFRDGNFPCNPAWTVVEGRFRVDS
ncbi:MAG: hypothetical protein VCD31_06410, partial [Alphaproteobacteria bacterium]